MATQRIKLTESELKEQIAKCITEALEDEGLWNNLKTGAKTFMSDKNKGKGFSGRWNNAKKNFSLQGEYDNIQKLISELSKFVDAGQIDPNKTIAQLIGGKYNGNKFGSMTGKMNNRMSQMKNNGLN